MSLYGPCNFALIMGKTQKTIELEEAPKKEISLMPEAINPNIINKQINCYMPKINTKEDLHKYILEIMKKEDKIILNYKYIFSLCLCMNKKFFTSEIIEDLLEEEFHITLIKWLKKERKAIEETNTDNPYQFNIYIGLLINIITLFEIIPIKSSDVCQFKFYTKLFKIYKIIKLNIKNSFPFLKSLNNLLNKWKKQIECFYLSKAIQNFTLLGKKTKNIKNKINNIEKAETDVDSDEKELLSFKKNKSNKKVFFDLEQNETQYFNKEDSPSQISKV